MLFVALFNAVCLHNTCILPLIFANAFCFHALSCVIDTVCLFKKSILHHTQCFYSVVSPNFMFTPFF